MTLINREFGPQGKEAEVTLDLGESYLRGETISLSQESGDIAVVEGVSLGGAKFGEDGKWAGGWSPFSKGLGKKKVKVGVPCATAMVVKLLNP